MKFSLLIFTPSLHSKAIAFEEIACLQAVDVVVATKHVSDAILEQRGIGWAGREYNGVGSGKFC